MALGLVLVAIKELSAVRCVCGLIQRQTTRETPASRMAIAVDSVWSGWCVADILDRSLDDARCPTTTDGTTTTN